MRKLKIILGMVILTEFYTGIIHLIAFVLGEPFYLELYPTMALCMVFLVLLSHIVSPVFEYIFRY